MRSSICVLLVFNIALTVGATQSFSQSAPSSLPNWSINCGLWRIDAGFSSLVQLKNRLVTMPILVTPALFMADGTEYDLPVVVLPPSGISTIDVNAALASAPSTSLSHFSDYGSLTLKYSGSESALMAQTALGSTVLSESYLSRFTSVMPGLSATQTLEGLWWARDAGVGGFVSLSNAAAQPRTVLVQAVSTTGQSLPSQSFNLASHANQMLDLTALLGRTFNAGEAGGLRIQFNGLLGEVNITAGLENRKEGYSAVIPFWQTPMAGMNMSTSTATIAHPGIMIGAAEPAMGFPVGTRFTPYLALRNLTSNAEQVNLKFYTEQGTALTAPVQFLKPFESRQVSLNSILQQFGLKDFNGALTLAVSHSGGSSDVMSVAGSVDATGTYVFEVEGRAAEEKLSKQSPYWSVKNGNDTMVSLWNSSGSAEEVMVTLKYADNSGNYHFHLHLAPYATSNIDVKELIANQNRDEDGNILPLDLQEGSFVFHNAKDVHAPLSLGVNVGIFNVIKGTCYYGTVYCDGYTGLIVSPSSGATLSGGGPQLTSRGQYNDGTTPGVTATWSSSNTGVATVGSSGLVTGVSGGTSTISASANLPMAGQWSGYNPSCAALQSDENFTGTASITVQTPTASRITQTVQSNALSQGQSPCAAGYGGWYRTVNKIVTDQSGKDIVAGNQNLTEVVTIGTPNALNITRVATGSQATNAQGQFQDLLYVCSAYCPGSSGTTVAYQVITDSAAGKSYTLSTNTFTYSCTGNKINGQ